MPDNSTSPSTEPVGDAAIRARIAYVDSGRHLPRPLRDFHDAKDVFKTMHNWWQAEFPKDDHYKMPSWTEGQIYVMDYFIRFMAFHGWTFQRSRAQVEFRDLRESIKERREIEAKAMREYMASRAATPSQEGKHGV